MADSDGGACHWAVADGIDFDYSVAIRRRTGPIFHVQAASSHRDRRIHMRFRLIDTVLERSPERIVAVKQVTAAEEYLGDHFPGFPVLPGVLMIEAMVQSARELLAAEGHPRHVLGQVRAVRYGRFVQPGESLRIEVAVDKRTDDGSVSFRGSAQHIDSAGTVGETAVAGRFTMRPIRTAAPSVEHPE